VARWQQVKNAQQSGWIRTFFNMTPQPAEMAGNEWHQLIQRVT